MNLSFLYSVNDRYKMQMLGFLLMYLKLICFISFFLYCKDLGFLSPTATMMQSQKDTAKWLKAIIPKY